MQYKKYEYDSFRIFTIQTDQFKNVHIEVDFLGDATKGNLTAKSFLSEIMSFSSLKYPTRKEFVIRLEELYNAYFYGVTTKVGKSLLTNFIFDFLDPYYVEEKHYLEDCVEFLFDTILNPNCSSSGFDYKTFQIIKSRLRSEIESLKENPCNKRGKAVYLCENIGNDLPPPLCGMAGGQRSVLCRAPLPIVC